MTSTYVNEPLYVTELIQFGENLDCFVLLKFKDETIKYYDQAPDGNISVEIVPLMIDGTNVFDLSHNSVWKVNVDRGSRTVLFGPRHILHDEGPFKYRIKSMKGKGLGTYILSRFIEMSQVFLREYGSDITMGAYGDNERLKNWYERFGFREGTPYHHKGTINDLRTNFTNESLKVLYSSAQCRDTCGFSKNLENAEGLITEHINEIERNRQVAKLKGKGNDRLFFGCIIAFILSIAFPKIAFFGFLLIVGHQAFVALQVSRLSP
jgi:hypothetical protein